MGSQQEEEAGKRRFGGAVGGSCENSAGLSICEYIWANITWIHLGKYLVQAWLDCVTKLQKYTPSA